MGEQWNQSRTRAELKVPTRHCTTEQDHTWNTPSGSQGGSPEDMLRWGDLLWTSKQAFEHKAQGTGLFTSPEGSRDPLWLERILRDIQVDRVIRVVFFAVESKDQGQQRPTWDCQVFTSHEGPHDLLTLRSITVLCPDEQPQRQRDHPVTPLWTSTEPSGPGTPQDPPGTATNIWTILGPPRGLWEKNMDEARSRCDLCGGVRCRHTCSARCT